MGGVRDQMWLHIGTMSFTDTSSTRANLRSWTRLELAYPHLPKSLPHGARPRIPVTQEECSFNANGGISRGWVNDNSIPFFNKAGARQSWYLNISRLVANFDCQQIPHCRERCMEAAVVFKLTPAIGRPVHEIFN